MAKLFKKQIKLTDLKTGGKVKTHSKKWWGRYRDEHGVERRVPLATDKTAAQMMLSELVKKTERRSAGLEDPFEKHDKRPLREHIADWERYLLNKGNTQKHVGEVVFKAKRILESCGWKLIRDLSANEAVACLAELRASGLSIQTTNHHIRAIKQLSRWLVRDHRTGDDRLAHLAMQNPKVDRRHDRRPLIPDEFRRLLHAAKSGPTVEGIVGPDRAMIYVLAAWTGFRKARLAVSRENRSSSTITRQRRRCRRLTASVGARTPRSCIPKSRASSRTGSPRRMTAPRKRCCFRYPAMCPAGRNGRPI